MTTQTRPLAYAEFFVLCLFAVALPLVEAPKNIFWALFLIIWLANSVRQRNFGQLACAWDVVFAALIAAPLLSMVLTVYTPQWKELGDIVGYVSLGWMLARSRLVPKQLGILLACLIGATLLGVLHGYWMLATEPKRIWLQLNSVGHVNHSALYGAGIALLAAAVAAVGWQSGLKRWRVGGLVLAVSMLGVMLGFASRGAFVAYAFGLLLVVWLLSGVGKKQLLAAGGLAILVGLGVQFLTLQLSGDKNRSTLIQKTLDGAASGNLSSFRLQAFHTAIEMARRYPLSGTGSGNFSAVSPEELQGWVEARGEAFTRDIYFFSSHAHGLYANTLGERALLGMAALLALLAGWSLALWRRRPTALSGEHERLAWGAGLAGWTVVFIGGLFNTTLHHEHGMLAMLCLGLLLANVPLRTKTVP